MPRSRIARWALLGLLLAMVGGILWLLFGMRFPLESQIRSQVEEHLRLGSSRRTVEDWATDKPAWDSIGLLKANDKREATFWLRQERLLNASWFPESYVEVTLTFDDNQRLANYTIRTVDDEP
jgi:hypothetical protein